MLHYMSKQDVINEAHEQKCLHIWAEFDLDPIIEVEGNHIRIRKGGVSMNEKEKATGT